MSRTGACLLAAAFAFASPAMAQDVEPASGRSHLTAFACETLATPLAVQVDILDDVDRNIRLRDQFAARLRQKGADVRNDAPLVLTLEIDLLSQAARHKPGDMVDVRVGGEDPEAGLSDFARVRMNVWSSTRDSLLTGRQDRLEEEGFDLLRLRASLNSKADGRCLWQGELVHSLDGDDAYGAAVKLVPVLADSIGRAASRQPVNVD